MENGQNRAMIALLRSSILYPPSSDLLRCSLPASPLSFAYCERREAVSLIGVSRFTRGPQVPDLAGVSYEATVDGTPRNEPDLPDGRTGDAGEAQVVDEGRHARRRGDHL